MYFRGKVRMAFPLDQETLPGRDVGKMHLKVCFLTPAGKGISALRRSPSNRQTAR